MTMNVLFCNFDNCKRIKSAPVEPSSNSQHPTTDGWVEVKNIHENGITIYMKKNADDTLTMVAYRNLLVFGNMKIATGQGRKIGEYTLISNTPLIFSPIVNICF